MSFISAEQLNAELDPAQWPEFDSITESDQQIRFALRIPDTLNYFAGHFPQQPVLPGVVQVHWAGELAQRSFAAHGFCEMKSVKFNSMILPGNTVTLSLDFQPEKSSVRFAYTDGDTVFSSGVLAFKGET